MLDLFGIVFSSSIMFLVILRAVQMDATVPWFKPAKTTADSSGLRLRPEDVRAAREAGIGPERTRAAKSR